MIGFKRDFFKSTRLFLQACLLLWAVGTSTESTFSMQEEAPEHKEKRPITSRFISYALRQINTLRDTCAITKNKTLNIMVTDPTSGLFYKTPTDITTNILRVAATENFLFCYSLGELRLVCKRWYLIIKEDKQMIESLINLRFDVGIDRSLERFKYKFRKSALLFKDKRTQIELPFDQLDNLFQGKFFLHSCGETVSKSIAIFTGFPPSKWQNVLMPSQVGIWIVPRFLVAQDIKEGKNNTAVVKRLFRGNSFDVVWPEKSEVSIIYTYKDERLPNKSIQGVFGKTMAQLSNDGSLYHLWHNQQFMALITYPPEVYAMERVLYHARHLRLQLLSDEYARPTFSR